MNYKDLVQEIANLPWEKAVPEDIILLSRGTAIEFAASLREAEKIYSNDLRLKEMIQGELETNNMTYEDYQGTGDHWEYLDYFIKKTKLSPSSDHITDAIRDYTETIKSLPPEERAMTIFSREEELTLIFRKIITSHDWHGLGYGFYHQYLAAHILFDSGEGGHHHLTQHFLLHESVLNNFYEIRLKLYAHLFDS